MIALLAAAVLHLTPPEQFFCDDRYRETLAQCVRRVRAYYCSEKSRVDRWPSDDRVAQLYAQAIREEQDCVCKSRRK